MKRLRDAALIALAALLTNAGSLKFAHAEDESRNDVEMAVMNQYIFRGMPRGDNGVMQLQGSVRVGKALGLDFDAGYFVNFNLVPFRANEGDISLKAGKRISNVEINGGYELYNYDVGGYLHNQELEAGMSINPVPRDKSLTASIGAYWNFDDGDLGSGVYTQAGASKDFGRGKNRLNISGSVGFNDNYRGEDSGFSDFKLGASFPIDFEKVTLTPTAEYTKTYMSGLDNGFVVGFRLSRTK